jgi:hypothetical protein
MKRKTQQVNSKQKHQPREAQPKNTAQHRFESGRHLITLNLGDGAFTALRLVAHAFEHPTPEDCALAFICSDVSELLPQITEAEAKKIVEASTIERAEQPASNVHEIVLKLSERAYAIVAGQAARNNWEGPEHWILSQMSGLLAQSDGIDHDGKEYAKLFGLKVDANGDTRLS